MSLLPIFSKVIEGVVFSVLFNFFLQNKLFTPCQSGFIRVDSCVSHLLSITDEICINLDFQPPTDMRDIFLIISEAFKKFWHEDLIFILKN